MSTTTKDAAARPTTTPPEPVEAPVRATPPPPPSDTLPPADPISEALSKALDSDATRSAGAMHKNAATKAVQSALEFSRSMRKLRSPGSIPPSDITGKIGALKPT